jgi:hypothetical protein
LDERSDAQRKDCLSRLREVLGKIRDLRDEQEACCDRCTKKLKALQGQPVGQGSESSLPRTASLLPEGGAGQQTPRPPFGVPDPLPLHLAICAEKLERLKNLIDALQWGEGKLGGPKATEDEIDKACEFVKAAEDYISRWNEQLKKDRLRGSRSPCPAVDPPNVRPPKRR